jgi:hypothetical protein
MKKSNQLLENTLLVSSILMFIYSFVGYVFLPPGTLAPPLKPSFDSNTVAIIAHAVFSSIAIVSGVIQLRRSFRVKYPTLNIRLRYIYFVSVLFGGFTGFYLAFFAYAGFANVVGFSLLAVLWLFTTYKAFISQKHDDMSSFRIWIVRSYALTFAAVTLRIYMGLFFLIFGYKQFEYFYATLGFLCWVPNLLFIEWTYLLPKFKNKLTSIKSS